MTELAFSGLGLNPVTATPPNINDPDLAPGGSSSGSAAAVAFGLAAAAIGSDTAGSVRIPAAWNDLVGLKTTHGLLSLDGVVPLRPAFDTVGPLARSVADASLLLAALGGPAIDLAGAGLGGVALLVLDDADAAAHPRGAGRGLRGRPRLALRRRGQADARPPPPPSPRRCACGRRWRRPRPTGSGATPSRRGPS